MFVNKGVPLLCMRQNGWPKLPMHHTGTLSLHVLASAGDHQRKANKQSADAIAP